MNDRTPAKSPAHSPPEEASASAAGRGLPLERARHYHFLGVGGIGMSALAEILHGRGYTVSGSDTGSGGQVPRLRARGIPVSVGHDAEALRGADVVVYSSAIGREHPVWAEVTRRGLPRLHRAELLGALGNGTHTVAVTGTHGKTTTSAALGYVLQRAGLEPTVVVGGNVGQFEGGNFLDGSGGWMVCEADESDASFLHLTPGNMLLTNVDADHLDFHGSMANIRAAFAAFVGRLPPGGVLACCADDPGAAAIAGDVRAGGSGGPRVVTYGTAPDADVRLAVERVEPGATRVRFSRDGESTAAVLRLIGRHNALNLCGAFALARALGIAAETVAAALEDFQGVARRQQYIGQAAHRPGLAVYDDYAHHPVEIQATLAAFREALGGPITAVFQPHLYSRTAHFAQAFAEALRAAERVYVCEIYGAREAPRAGVTAQLVLEHLRDHPHARYLPHWEALLAVREELPDGVLLTLGAGDVTELGPRLVGEGA